MITHPRFVTLYVRDQQAALDFWTRKVGFELTVDQPYDQQGPARWIEVRPPNGETAFVLHPVDAEHDSLVGTMSAVWFQCDDLDATFRDLTAKGVAFPVEPTPAPWNPGSRWAQFADHEGNTYGLSED